MPGGEQVYSTGFLCALTKRISCYRTSQSSVYQGISYFVLNNIFFLVLQGQGRAAALTWEETMEGPSHDAQWTCKCKGMLEKFESDISI